MAAPVPPYFDFLIDAFHRGRAGRFVHLGHWDAPPTWTQPEPGEFEQAQARLNDVVLSLADLDDGQAVLDVGCGFGGAVAKINADRANMTLVGVNIDPRQLDICRQLRPKNGNRLEWLEADACHLPFAAESFDRVLCIEAMFHFASRKEFLREAARILRRDGWLVVSDILIARLATSDVSAARIEDNLRGGYGPWPEVWCTAAELRALAVGVGLTCTREIDATAATLPSHRFTAPADFHVNDEIADPTARAGVTLRWLHETAGLSYRYFVFVKPPGAALVTEAEKDR